MSETTSEVPEPAAAATPPVKTPVKKAAKKAAKKVAKKAAKKVAKKAAKKAPAKKKPKAEDLLITQAAARRRLGDPVLNNLDVRENLRNMMKQAAVGMREIVVSHYKTAIGFSTLAEVRTAYIPLHNIALEALIGSCGIPHRTLGSVVGATHIGKTTLALQILGAAAASLSPGLFINTEGKFHDQNRILRCLSTDPVEASERAQMIQVSECFELAQAQDTLLRYVRHMRDEISYPMEYPLLVVIDSWSKLMSKAEALGYFDENPAYVDEKARKKEKQVGEAANLGHSKFSQHWSRLLPYLMARYNFSVILIEHQNVHFEMSPKPGARPVSALNHVVKIGGLAINQSAAWQIIIQGAGTWNNHDRTKTFGTEIVARAHKARTQGRLARWNLRNADVIDKPGRLEEPLVWHIYFARKMAEEKLLDVTVNKMRYTSKALGVEGVESETLWQALYARPDMLSILGKELNIVGYDDRVDQIQREQEMMALKVEADQRRQVPEHPGIPEGLPPPPPLPPEVLAQLSKTAPPPMPPTPPVDIDEDEAIAGWAESDDNEEEEA